MKRVAVVTGGNKGIGFAIVKGLCKDFDGIVYLTARDEIRGKNAVSALEKEGLKANFHQLDITNVKSIELFSTYLKEKYHGLDVLVNNAAIAYKHNATEPFGVQAEETIRVNFFGTRQICDALFPLLKSHARVVHVSSSAGRLSNIPGKSLRKKLTDPKLTEQALDGIMQEFVRAAKSDSHLELGWANSAYVASKVGLNALTCIHQAMFNSDVQKDIVVNAVHPGYVDTDMTSHKGILKPEEGAVAPTFCALLPENTDIKGKYVWCDKTLVDWTDDAPTD